MTDKNVDEPRRFGIGELYGRSFADLTGNERRQLASPELLKKPKIMECLPRCHGGRSIRCNKPGGICSLRLYQKTGTADAAIPVDDRLGRLRTTCPHRFEQDGLIYRWIGGVLLNDHDPVVLGQIGFLEPIVANEDSTPKKRTHVGRIDNVLVSRRTKDPLQWCALEAQAVYFQGKNMGAEWEAIRESRGNAIPFPRGKRQLDYRSSGPKRLMPQLQIKVPTLRRWGKKMAVVVDEDFFESMAPMAEVDHVGNCDIAWFVVGYDTDINGFTLAKRRMVLTTLEAAVDGLTAGVPTTLPAFEARIRQKALHLLKHD